MEISFSSKEELYKRVKPALKAKKRELARFGYPSLLEIDIWNYLVKNKWMTSYNLTLSDIVDDIMKLEGRKVTLFLKEQRQQEQTEENLEII